MRRSPGVAFLTINPKVQQTNIRRRNFASDFRSMLNNHMSVATSLKHAPMKTGALPQRYRQ